MAPSSAEIGERVHTIVIKHLEKLTEYEPAHGRSRSTRLDKEKVREAFAADPLYSIFGLDSPQYVAATLGGGMITSIHRKIGDLHEESVREIFRLTLDLGEDDVRYSAQIASGEEVAERSLDCFIPFAKLTAARKARFLELALEGFKSFGRKPRVNPVAVGIEIRHCYQSADSKRAQADEAIAMHCAVSGILPLMLVFCNQSNQSILRRYRNVWRVREGMESYNLVKEYSGFDFHGFLMRNKNTYRGYVQAVLRKLA